MILQELTLVFASSRYGKNSQIFLARTDMEILAVIVALRHFPLRQRIFLVKGLSLAISIVSSLET